MIDEAPRSAERQVVRVGAPPVGAFGLAKAIVWAQRKRLGVGLLLLFIDRGASFVIPFAPKVLLDDVIAARRPDLLPWLAGAMIGAAVVQAAATFALTRVLGLSAERLVLGWRRRIMAHVTRLPAAELDGTPAGTLVSRIMDDAAAMQNLVGWELVRWGSNVLTAVLAFGVLLWIDWRITLLALGFASIPALGIDAAYRRLKPLYGERGRLRAEVAGRLTQTMSGLRIVKAYAAERREALVFARGLHRLFRVFAQTTTRRSAMSAVAVILSAGVIAIVVVAGGRAILSGAMTLGDFGTYVAFALTFAAPLVDLPEIAARVSETLADLDRLQALASVPAEEDGGPDVNWDPSADSAALAFDRVSFAYAPEVTVLTDVSFTAAAGTTTAIVGPSGAGKSTIFALLLRLYRPSRGAISLGGRDVATLPLRAYRRRFAVVLQDDFLFDGTIAENVAFAKPRASRDEIAEACRAANCDEFLRVLPDGLDTLVGERGAKLSGGQRQRVSIARALLADAPILLLDEATSHLDGESEALVRDAIANLRRGRTVLVIAHRLSTIQSADRILVLDRGRIVEAGRHDALAARVGGRYRAILDAFAGTSDLGAAGGDAGGLTNEPRE